jgi:hypothetical protein
MDGPMSTGIQGAPFDSSDKGSHAAHDGASKRWRKKPRRWRTRAGTGVLLAFGIIVLGLLYTFVHHNFIDPPVQPEVMRDGTSHIIQLDVLNGSGASNLAQRFTDYLRARGFDVVEMGNYTESGVEFTRVIDRTGDLQAAKQVAQALGVSEARVTQEIERNAYLDVTVVIGKDFRALKPLQ